MRADAKRRPRARRRSEGTGEAPGTGWLDVQRKAGRVAAMLLLLLASGAWRPASPSEASPTYVFQPGDVIDVVVSSHSGYDRVITIQPDGRIHFPIAGEIVAAGLTAEQLATRLREGLTQELVDPSVTVSLKELNHVPVGRVSVLGAVRSPGTFELREKSTLAELLAAAGGPLPAADLARVTITPSDRAHVRTVDLSRAAETGQAEGDVRLEPGDLIIVPAGAAPTALVTGAVAKTGSYAIQDGARAMDLISLAGGAAPAADLAHVRLTRAGQNRVLDLGAVAGGGARADSDANPMMRPGDALVVPENANQVYLLGEVARPAAYPLQPGDHLFDVLTRAGGTTSQANAEKAVLIRRDANGQPAAQPIDLVKMLTRGGMKNNLALQQGDVLLIPGRRPGSRSPLGALGSVIAPFTGLFGLLLR
jgi:polysaccharide export outer membrane protein